MSPLLKGWGSEPHAFTDARVGDLMTRSHETLTCEEVLLELVRLHEQVADDDAAVNSSCQIGAIPV